MPTPSRRLTATYWICATTTAAGIAAMVTTLAGPLLGNIAPLAWMVLLRLGTHAPYWGPGWELGRRIRREAANRRNALHMISQLDAWVDPALFLRSEDPCGQRRKHPSHITGGADRGYNLCHGDPTLQPRTSANAVEQCVLCAHKYAFATYKDQPAIRRDHNLHCRSRATDHPDYECDKCKKLHKDQPHLHRSTVAMRHEELHAPRTKAQQEGCLFTDLTCPTPNCLSHPRRTTSFR
jgi:hypothetical protein